MCQMSHCLPFHSACSAPPFRLRIVFRPFLPFLAHVRPASQPSVPTIRCVPSCCLSVSLVCPLSCAARVAASIPTCSAASLLPTSLPAAVRLFDQRHADYAS